MSKEEILKQVVTQAVSTYQALEARSSFDEVIHESEVFNALDSEVKVLESQVEEDGTQVGSRKYYNKLLNSTPEELVKDYNLGLK